MRRQLIRPSASSTITSQKFRAHNLIVKQRYSGKFGRTQKGFSQTFTQVSIKKLDFELEISITCQMTRAQPKSTIAQYKSSANNLQLLFQYNSLYLNPLHRHFTKKWLQLPCYSLSTTRQIVSSVANQRTAFVIECQQIYTKTRYKLGTCCLFLKWGVGR